MHLQYLDFDFSDEDTGRGSFDAMASVTIDRLPALLAEVACVLNWCSGTFGPCTAPDMPDDVAEWDHELQAMQEPDLPLDIAFDERRGEIAMGRADGAGEAARVTVTFTLSGSPAFCDALRDEFGING